ncbi:MAG TPA: undecaprenyldiphospho-muramoylpentapeptide beta-N-acetylglucosaminyltransferase [Salinimicrobium sp.]|nr:undecaprenyldiphospho-muramoylpentapeptide beta-N-acetylglucosaminyltransferase [Salinimicrobium sp.]
MKKPLHFILSGGGTGGHIYPAVSIADEIKRRFPDAEILFVGAQDRMEMQKVPEAGYKIEGLWISGIQRQLTMKNLMFPFKMMSSLWKSIQIINKFKPDVAIGTGGFASGPLLQVAHWRNIPTLIQEQNSFPGITNKWLGKKANVICTAYDQLDRFFPAEKIRITGNPVRNDLLKVSAKRAEAFDFFRLEKDRKVILVLGGSLGARRINQLLEEFVNDLVLEGAQIIWQTGKLYYETYKKFGEKEFVQIHEYLNNMNFAYAAADIIISRAGAGTVSELCIVGKPVVFIPSPNVAEDHQTKNALAIANKDAAIVVHEKNIKTEFREQFFPLLKNEKRQEELSVNIKKLARPNATKEIVDEIEKLLKKGNKG